MRDTSIDVLEFSTFSWNTAYSITQGFFIMVLPPFLSGQYNVDASERRSFPPVLFVDSSHMAGVY
jgi:hypothetical protein